jgi:hypothetical protein
MGRSIALQCAVLFFLACSGSVPALALDPIASVSDALPVNRTGIDWVVALEYNPSAGSTAFTSIQSLLSDAARSLFQSVSAASPQRMGLVFNGQPVLSLTANLQSVISAISYVYHCAGVVVAAHY